MNETLSSNEKREESLPSDAQKPGTNGRLKDLLVNLISSSRALDARVWLDGVYTDIDDEQAGGDSMNDRDVYFKVEGRRDKRSGS